MVIGCGGGKECSYFIAFGASEVHGLDIGEKVGHEYIHPKVKYFKMSAENMEGIEDNEYDLVHCIATMEHIPRIDIAFSEMVRICKPGGIIYCVSSPLWNSRYGHHKGDYFRRFPWIHLRMNEDGINEYCQINNITDQTGRSMKGHIAYMLSPRNFNKISAKKYVEVCNSLDKIDIICNKLDFDDEEELTTDIYSELRQKGYTAEELLATTHTLIAQKL